MWNGSAAFRAVIPAIVSTLLVLIYDTYWKKEMETMVEDTYTITVMVAFFGFLLTTRLNFAYARWWEAASMCHQMTSKLIDSAMCLAACHFQAKIWEPIMPDTFGDSYASKRSEKKQHPASNLAKSESKRVMIGSQLSSSSSLAKANKKGGFFQWVQEIFYPPTVKVPSTDNTPPRHRHIRSLSAPIMFTKSFRPNDRSEKPAPTPIYASQRPPSKFSPSDFLEEMIHLYSLLNAVAMASLRHDVEGCPSPLAEYIPNRPFPPYNSDNFKRRHGHLRKPSEAGDVIIPRTWWDKRIDRFWNLFYFLAGINRSPKQRTIYNAARPFHVLGGVSEAEAHRLQLARGHNAQVALCQLWLKEFITREYLHGSIGDVAPPIVGRVYHFLTDAMSAYHQCSKIAFVPFPFPHEQMTSLFTLIVVLCYPVLSVAYVNDITLACLLNFSTILCFQGIYEVARELSNPYHTVPNDLPLNRFHVELNESLRSFLMGYHPDWKKTFKGESMKE